MKRFFKVVLGLSLALFSTLYGDVNVERSGNVISLTSDGDIVQVLQMRNDDKAIEKLQAEGPGIGDGEGINSAFRSGNMPATLFHLWSESDDDKRIAWLEEQLSSHHPVIHLEYARELAIRAEDEKEWLDVISHFGTAVNLANCDTKCTSDKSVTAIIGAIAHVVLPSIFAKLPKDELIKYSKMGKNEKEYLRQNFIEVLEEMLAPNFPLHSPEWVFGHGMSAFTGSSNTIPKGEWDHLRKDEMSKEVEKLQNEGFDS